MVIRFTVKPESLIMGHYPYTVIQLYSYLKEWHILEHVESVIENDKSTAIILIVKKSRFYSEFVAVHRLSRTNYHINWGSQQYRGRTANESAKILKKIINNIYFDIPADENNQLKKGGI